MIITVVLPFYNAEPYLDRTFINLIREQFNNMSRTDWEIIAVDDGSTDGSATIARSWALRFPQNVRLLQQPNAGVSAARNLAMAEARGRWLYFMDADDLLVPSALPALIEAAESTRCDLLRFLHRDITPSEYKEGEGGFSLRLESEGGFSLRFHTTSATDFLATTHGMMTYPALWSVWSALFRTEFLRRHRMEFVPGLHIGEDCVFMWQVLMHSPAITLVDEQLYLYQRRPDNATNSVTPAHLHRRYESLLMEVRRLEPIAEELPVGPARAGLRRCMMHSLRMAVAYALALNRPMTEVLDVTRQYCRHGGGSFNPEKKVFGGTDFRYPRSARLRVWAVCRLIALGLRAL